MPRWKGNGRHSREGTTWKHVRCDFCGLYYRDLRVKDFFGINDLWEHCKSEQEKEVTWREQSNDYSKPVNRRSVLGRMFEYKQLSWNKHSEECEASCYQIALSEGFVNNPDEFYELVHSLDVPFTEYRENWCPF